MLDLLIGTIQVRPYVFVFLGAFVAIATVQTGWRRMISFAVIGFLVGLGSEVLSLRTGFPYSHYEYLSYGTRDKELWVGGVPVMASLSFIFLTYTGLAMAMVVCGRFDRRGPWMRFDSFTTTLHLPAVLVLAPLFTTLLDVVIDPVALQGKHWFLGDLYRYKTDGLYFGVPLSNFAGWYLVTFSIVAAFQFIDRQLDLGGDRATRITPEGNTILPPAWPGVTLYGAVLAFNVVVTFAIGQTLMGVISSIISLAGFGFVALRFAPPVKDAWWLITSRKRSKEPYD